MKHLLLILISFILLFTVNIVEAKKCVSSYSKLINCHTSCGWVEAKNGECGQVGCTKQWDAWETVCTKYAEDYYRYTIDCLVDESGDIVSQTDEIVSDKAYKIVEKTFDVIKTNTSTKTFCIGKLKSKTEVSY